MIDIPADLTTHYDVCLNRENVPDKFHSFYRKWLRYYLDFCHKYDFEPSGPQSLAHFIVKLQSKNQSPVYQQQAGHAVSLYYDMLKEEARKARCRTTTEELPLHVSEAAPIPLASSRRNPVIYSFTSTWKITSGTSLLTMENY